ncbi:putative disease resistance RPP13-like protein 1 [Rutidosis leptorrhynchoides]|uniref:putative disease resistance RPP13-like protein 1 n=1 Tax=Rutidosis leptorrhynchoides TaxID=125765 RepID=UPI003A9A329A
MDSVVHHNLGLLSDEDALSLLVKSAMGKHNFDDHPLFSLAQDIIKKCKGLPLALLAIGRVLKRKGNDEWDKLLKSEIWSSDDGEGDILPVLKLSYYDLPLHKSKRLFPKDYWFDKNELVLLWMAEGFISESKDTKTMESLGRQYFKDLVSRSFFQHSTENKSVYVMHDLMHDLAISVAGKFFFMLDKNMNVNGRNENFDEIRHFSFLAQPGEEFIIFKELRKSKRLRTFLPVSVYWWSRFIRSDPGLVKLLPRLQLLRVLSLNQCSIRKVPQSIGGLKHLRYLNFSKTDIEEVPEQVEKVFIKQANGFKISDLEGLVNLEGHLSIYGLEKVADSQQARDANLEGKKGLVSLDMEWGDIFDDSRNKQIEYEVIEGLRPHSKLNKLKILNYGGMEFPSCFANPSFDKLTELRIKGCKNCTHFHGIAFPLLEYLEVSDMKCLEKWSNCDGDQTTRSFLRLREIRIENCLKLAEVSIGAVEILKIKNCYELKEVNVGSSNTKCVLRDVNLVGCSSLESYNCPNTVERLEISFCKSMTSLTLSLPSSLKVLTIWCCENLKSIPDELPSSLEVLEIVSCKNLKSFPHEYLQSLISLKEMKIIYCPRMDDTFPSGLWPPNLRKLEIGELKKPMSEWGLQNTPLQWKEMKIQE